MIQAHDTAYPRLKSRPSNAEIKKHFQATPKELKWVCHHTRASGSRLGLLVLLKTFQRLGYFLHSGEIPKTVVRYLAQTLGLDLTSQLLAGYDHSGTRRSHVNLVRDFLVVRSYRNGGEAVLQAAMLEGYERVDDLADLVNIALDELVRQGFELPGFSTLAQTAQHIRSSRNEALYTSVFEALDLTGCALLETLWLEPGRTPRTRSWNDLKLDAPRGNASGVTSLLKRLVWFKQFIKLTSALNGISQRKREALALEARALNSARMVELEVHKRFTLAVALVFYEHARTIDDLVNLFIKRMQRLQLGAKEAFLEANGRRSDDVTEIATALSDVLSGLKLNATDTERFQHIKTSLDGKHDHLGFLCDRVLRWGLHQTHTYLPQPYRTLRKGLLALVSALDWRGSPSAKGLLDSVRFMLEHQFRKNQTLFVLQTISWSPKMVDRELVDLSWLDGRWKPWVSDFVSLTGTVRSVKRTEFEICVLVHLLEALRSGVVFVIGSFEFGNLEDQLVSMDEVKRERESFLEQVGLAPTLDGIVEDLKTRLNEQIAGLNNDLPESQAVRMKGIDVVLKQLPKRLPPTELPLLLNALDKELEDVSLPEALAASDHLVNWSRFFSPLSGFSTKLNDARVRYLATVFCYGCNLGPTQSAKSLPSVGMDRFAYAYLDSRHISHKGLDRAITELVNAYNRFDLPRHWGSGERASADGMKWDVYDDNLLAEYHIRYGGYGGIGYYHVSDTYIALFSRFIPCGTWEATFILDGLMDNPSDVQPHILHGDTQAQNAAVFGLAYLLGIELMPRIRRWREYKIYSAKAEHSKFGWCFVDDQIDWKLIEDHLPQMLRVAISIKLGRIAPSKILATLGSYSLQNPLYLAFREFGRAVRSIFLLRYMRDLEVRRFVDTAPNKSEQFNGFLRWSYFGGEGRIEENSRDEQRKRVKYNHLVANSLVFYNVYVMTKALRNLEARGVHFSKEVLEFINPYRTGHVHRYGEFVFELDREVEAPDYEYRVARETVSET